MCLLIFQVTSLLLVQYTVTIATSSSSLRPSSGNPAYESLGCFRDSNNRCLPDRYELKENTVEGCFRKALELKYTIFAVQYGGECWLDDQRKNNYNKYGTSTDCRNGTGGIFANDVYKIRSEFIALMQRCKVVKASLSISCGDANLVALKHIGTKARTNQPHYNVSQLIFIVKVKISPKNIELKEMNSTCELEMVHAKQKTNYELAITTAESLTVWFAKPLVIDPNEASLKAQLKWNQQPLMMTSPDAVILYGIPITPICPNTTCLSMYIDWRNYVRNTNQTICMEDLEALTLRFKPCNGYCLPETTGLKSLQGRFEWNLTFIGQTADLKCPYGPSGTKVSRFCEGSDTVDGVWSRPSTAGCSYLSLTTEKLYNLSKTKVDNKNVKRIAMQMKNLISGSKPKRLTGHDAALTAEVLEDVIAVPGALQTTARDVIETIGNVMQMNATPLANSQKDHKVSSKLLRIIDLIGENLPLNETQPSRLLTTSNIAIYSHKIDVTSFTGLTFAVRSSSSRDQTLSEDKILKKLPPAEEVETSISLPRDLFANQQSANSSTQMSFVVYQNSKFFQPIDGNSSARSFSINSRVIAASARGIKLRNITAPGVEMTFLLLHPQMAGGPVCVFWDFNALGGFGNWSDEGCKFVGMKAERVTCRCNHMTHFAVLFSVHGAKVESIEKEHIKALTIISYIGCGISLVGLSLTLMTYCLFSNLRKTSAQPILMNFCLSLMLLLIVFMVGSGKRENKYVCHTVAILLHYFLLTTVMWMAVEGYQMYLAFIQVMATYTRHFILKCSLIAWGVPAIIVTSTALGAKVAGVPQDLYINPEYCVLTGIPLYAAVFAPVLLILTGNFVIFGVVIYSMAQSRAFVSEQMRRTSYQRVRVAVAILVLLGLTWVFGFLALGSARLVFEYLFCIFNSLQGFFIFVFHCLRQKDAQRQWIALFKGKGTSYNPTKPDKHGKCSVPGFFSQSNANIGAVSWRRQHTETSSVIESTVGDSPKRNSVLKIFFAPSPP